MFKGRGCPGSFKVFAVLLAALFSLVPFSGAFALAGIDKACRELASEMTGPHVKGKTLAVRPFLSVERRRTVLSLRLQDAFTDALAAGGRSWHVVERTRISELDLERSTYGAEEDLERWSRGLKADLIVLGAYAVDGRTLQMDCRLVEPAGRVMWSGRRSFEATPLIAAWASTPAPSTPVMAAMESIGVAAAGRKGEERSRVSLFRLHNGEMEGFPAGEPVQISVGRSMGFSVMPPMDCFLYVLNYDPQSPDDRAIFLYPLPQFAARVFLGGRTYFFPRDVEPRALSYPVEPPLGRMVFKVLGVMPGALQTGLTHGLDAGSGYYEVGAEGLKAIIRRLRGLPDAAWWEENLEFWITGQ